MLQLGSCRKAIWKANSIESPTGEKYVTRICADTTPDESEYRDKKDSMEVLIDGLRVLKFKNNARQYKCYVPSAPISTPLTTMTIKAKSSRDGSDEYDAYSHMALRQITIYFSDDGNVNISLIFCLPLPVWSASKHLTISAN